MPDAHSLHSINILIPGYSIEDLPTDLSEEDAASLLNAVCVAWHPFLLAASRSLPEVRQAEVAELPVGGQIALVPSCSEEWLGHDWQEHFENTESPSIVLHSAIQRDEWQTQIDEHFGFGQLSLDSQQLLEELASHFYALGLHHLLVCLMSRRMHFYVDPDSSLLETAAVSAAEAVLAANRDQALQYLTDAFETLLDCREQFHPTDCFQIDLCLPTDQTTASELKAMLQQAKPVSILASGRQLYDLFAEDSELDQLVQQHVNSGTVAVISGMFAELRPTLSPFSATYTDMQLAQEHLPEMSDRSWGRRRFGHSPVLPGLLKHFGFESALHVVLDDGLYPDRERSRFLWQGRDGSRIAASSRIPLAIDSASSMLRFADHFAESMHDNTTAVILLARLPNLQTPWLDDLRLGSAYNGVLGNFVTFGYFAKHAEGDTNVSYKPSEYLSPHLIQSTVLKTEAPISHPAKIFRLRRKLQQTFSFYSQLKILQPAHDLIQSISNLQENHFEKAINNIESRICDRQFETQPAKQWIDDELRSLELAIDTAATEIKQMIAARLGTKNDQPSRLLLNPVPWEVEHVECWPHVQIAANKQIESVYRQDDSLFVKLKIPANGFVWLGSQGTPASIDQPGQKQLAEPLLLRNQFFEVTISPVTGGIADVRFHQQRSNRISQHVALHYEHGQTMSIGSESKSVSYATTKLISDRIIHAGPATGAIETVCEIVDVQSQQTLATFRQITTVYREQPTLQILIEFDDVSSINGNPWMSYIASRFAWDNEMASLTGSMLGQAFPIQSERFESPDLIEIADSDQQLTIYSHGRPYHRRSGPRMLDSLLIVENEDVRSFEFTLDFDQQHPFRRAIELDLPVSGIDVQRLADKTTSSWLQAVSAEHVVIADTKPTSGGYQILLQEVEGRPAKFQLHLARTPKSVAMLDGRGTQISELPNPEKCRMAIPAFGMMRLELTF